MRNYACDDGNANSDDGCSSTCTIEDGYYCVDSATKFFEPVGYGVDNCYDICGDGKLMD